MQFSRSDTVDANGKVFKTVGANIRYGARNGNSVAGDMSNEFTESELCGMHTLPFMIGKGKWITVADVITDGKHNVGEYQSDSTDANIYFIEKVRYVIPTMLEHSVFDSSNKIRISKYGQIANSKCLSVGFDMPVTSNDNEKLFYLYLWVSEE